MANGYLKVSDVKLLGWSKSFTDLIGIDPDGVARLDLLRQLQPHGH